MELDDMLAGFGVPDDQVDSDDGGAPDADGPPINGASAGGSGGGGSTVPPSIRACAGRVRLERRVCDAAIDARCVHMRERELIGTDHARRRAVSSWVSKHHRFCSKVTGMNDSERLTLCDYFNRDFVR